MEIFTINESGESNGIVQGCIDSVLWVERYREGGDFSISGTKPDELLTAFPLYSLVTHTETDEVMIVEDQEVEETYGQEPSVTISGRGLDQYLLENRRITVRAPGGDYSIGQLAAPGAGYLMLDVTADWYLIKTMIQDFLIDGIESTRQEVDGLVVSSDYTEHIDPEYERDYYFAGLPTLYSEIIPLLERADLGIKLTRPSFTSNSLKFKIYKGEETDIAFSWFVGDLESVRYFWSTRNHLTTMYVYDDRVEDTDTTFVAKVDNGSGSAHGIRHKEGAMPANDLGLELATRPYDAGEFAEAKKQMHYIGEKELLKHKETKLIDAEVKVNARHKYKIDYNLGDIVRVVGNYGLSSNLRVTEYALSYEREEGVKGYPTLTEPFET